MKKFTTFFLLASYFLLPTSAFAQSIDIIWQGETYTPPFYKGLPIWSYQSRVTLLATPQGLGNPSALNYRWTRDGTVLGSLSGLGKNSYTFSDNVLSRTKSIKVEIVSSEEEILAESSVYITPRQPSIQIYENSPLYGYMFHQAVEDSYSLKEGEVSFTAFPLFFSTNTLSSPTLNYKWLSNAGTSESGPSVTYRAPEGVVGRASVSTNITSTSKILETADSKFLVQFGQ